MADQYYDPTTWQTIDPSRVKKRDAFYNPTEYGTQSYGESFWYDGSPGGMIYGNDGGWWWEDPTGKEAKYGDVLQDYLGQFGTKTRNYLSGLNTQYGLGVNDFQNAIQSYIKNSNTDANQQSLSWQGDEGSLYMFGNGLDYLNPSAAYKGSWEPLWDRGAYNSQQKTIGDNIQASQNMGSDWDDLKGILAGVGTVLGAGALAGAFGGLGAASGAAPGWVSAEGGAGYLGGAAADASALAGAAGSGAAPGWTSGQDLLGGADLNFTNMSAPATGTSGGQAMDWTDFIPSGTDSGGSFLDYLPTDAGPLTDVGSNLNLSEILQGMSDIPAGAAGSANWMDQLRSLIPGGSGYGDSNSLASLLGKLAGPALGAYASNQQANALADIARQYSEYGAPYRAQLAQLQADPGSFLNSPRVQTAVDQGTNAMARALSARDGNPVGSGRALHELQNYATNSLYGQLTNRENQLANFGGLSNFNAAAPQTGLASVAQTGNMWNSIGAGLNDVFNPQPTYLDLVKAMKGLA